AARRHQRHRRAARGHGPYAEGAAQGRRGQWSEGDRSARPAVQSGMAPGDDDGRRAGQGPEHGRCGDAEGLRAERSPVAAGAGGDRAQLMRCEAAGVRTAAKRNEKSTASALEWTSRRPQFAGYTRPRRRNNFLETSDMGKIIGIDLGTTNSCVAIM